MWAQSKASGIKLLQASPEASAQLESLVKQQITPLEENVVCFFDFRLKSDARCNSARAYLWTLLSRILSQYRSRGFWQMVSDGESGGGNLSRYIDAIRKHHDLTAEDLLHICLSLLLDILRSGAHNSRSVLLVLNDLDTNANSRTWLLEKLEGAARNTELGLRIIVKSLRRKTFPCLFAWKKMVPKNRLIFRQNPKKSRLFDATRTSGHCSIFDKE
jgi:hypothetical protein